MAREWTHIDKSAWGPGPWVSEPDKVQWVDPKTNLDCLMVRQERAGHWCGYVGVAEGHPAFDQHYDNVRIGPCPDDDHWKHEPYCAPDVHGGLTFAGLCQEDAEEGHGICHIPEPGRPDKVWWLGFDCHHGDDLAPAYAARYPDWPKFGNEVYRDRAYVESEVANLARQLAEMANAA